MQNWRESRLFIFLSATLATFLFAAFITFTYVIPIYQKQDSNTIIELKSEIKKLNLLHKETVSSLNNENDLLLKKVNDLQLNNESLTSKNNDYKIKLLELSTLSTFQHGQPLPIGYSSILPGMKLSIVPNKYKKENLDIDPKGEFITVNVETGGIERIIYSAGIEEAPGIITSITVYKYDLETSINGKRTDNKDNELSLLKFLQENLGHKSQCASGQYLWLLDEYRYIYYNEDTPYYYGIFFNGIYEPGASSKCLDLIKAPEKKKTL